MILYSQHNDIYWRVIVRPLIHIGLSVSSDVSMRISEVSKLIHITSSYRRVSLPVEQRAVFPALHNRS